MRCGAGAGGGSRFPRRHRPPLPAAAQSASKPAGRQPASPRCGAQAARTRQRDEAALGGGQRRGLGRRGEWKVGHAVDAQRLHGEHHALRGAERGRGIRGGEGACESKREGRGRQRAATSLQARPLFHNPPSTHPPRNVASAAANHPPREPTHLQRGGQDLGRRVLGEGVGVVGGGEEPAAGAGRGGEAFADGSRPAGCSRPVGRRARDTHCHSGPRARFSSGRMLRAGPSPATAPPAGPHR